METAEMKVIARIRTEFSTKFGIPRQSGLVEGLRATIVFEKEYRNKDALRGLEEFSHIWLIWQFSEAVRSDWSPTVRPPRLGGNARMGVFATRSPFRPNAVGLSSVRLLGIEWDTPEGAVLHVGGADLMDGTPIFDIKPYIPYADAHAEAVGGFAAAPAGERLAVVLPEELAQGMTQETREALRGVLAQDPRPSYHDDAKREYGFSFAGREVKFRVAGDTVVVTAIE